MVIGTHIHTKIMATIIYQPKGKAKEYSPWAANFYNGCSNKCDYCYNRHCQAKALLGKDEPTLKKALIDEGNAVKVFVKELEHYKVQILNDCKGLFFNFVSDPMLEETRLLNIACILEAIKRGVPCVVLTKCTGWLSTFKQILAADETKNIDLARRMVKFGFTLTGMDELEHSNATNDERMKLMYKLYMNGFHTWASIEPVIDIKRALDVIEQCAPYCHEFKVGLLSGKKTYTSQDIKNFCQDVVSITRKYHREVIFKDSVLNFIKEK